MSVADRSILVLLGRARAASAGLPFRVTIDPGGPHERVLAGLCDDEPIAAGEIVRIETTGGGGWGDPLDRDPERVALDVLQGKVSPAAAATSTASCSADGRVDDPATAQLRERMRAERGEPAFFDRGPRLRAPQRRVTCRSPARPCSVCRSPSRTGIARRFGGGASGHAQRGSYEHDGL